MQGTPLTLCSIPTLLSLIKLQVGVHRNLQPRPECKWRSVLPTIALRSVQ